MLDYLNAVFPNYGVFESEKAAWDWVETYDHKQRDRYTPFMLTVNNGNEVVVPTTSKFRSYKNQR